VEKAKDNRCANQCISQPKMKHVLTIMEIGYGKLNGGIGMGLNLLHVMQFVSA